MKTIKVLIALVLMGSNLLANEAESFFHASKDNFLICRAGYETYVMISSANASIVNINGSKYFRYKQKDYYFPLSGCQDVKSYEETPQK